MTRVALSDPAVSEQTDTQDGDLLVIERGGAPAKITAANLFGGAVPTPAGATLSSQASAQAQAAVLKVGLEFIATADASDSATIDFTAFDAARYDAYEFVISGLTPATDAANLWLRTSSDGGSSFDDTAGEYSYIYDALTDTGTGSAINGNASTVIQVANAVSNSATAGGLSGKILMPGPGLAKFGRATWHVSVYSSSSQLYTANGSGARLSAAAIDGVRFLFSTGNIASGTITMFGVRNA